QYQSANLEEDSPVQKPLLYILWRSVAIAASVLLVIGLVWLLSHNSKTPELFAKGSSKTVDSVTFVERHEVNTTGKEKAIHMADGSLIVMADNSEITYAEPFTNKRNITLIGKAYFQVAHDKTRPFTVTSGDISTTAIGTAFSVTVIRNTLNISVRLYEGKVVIKPIDKTNKRMKEDIYLLPGQEFVYG